MPRNHNPGTLRNRNRITNKTRLKVIHGDIDADPLVLEEDEEKARVVSTAGVDAEDANEHHLQVVLSAASRRHLPSSPQPRKDAPTQPEAYIPIPDSTGVVDDYTKLYPTDRWIDPTTYVRASDTVDDAIDAALADGFTYYMDERDHDWLEKNNEAARGEGTSAQGSVSGAGTSTRAGRSAKAKGKEPDVPSPIAMSEDEFELIMGVFEKVTHEKTEFLHHSLETGMTFPAFSEYQESFATELPASMFATFTIPSWLPAPTQLSKLAQVVYPYWRERRIERGGHRIIPALNYDESDIKNESYICFRRREVKTVRKTRAQQVSFSEKLLRLQAELSVALELAQNVENRETLKNELHVVGQTVWKQRLAMVDLKRKAPTIGAKEDEEHFQDKERAPKKPKQEAPRAITIRHPPIVTTPVAAEPPIKPRERWEKINASVEYDLARIKEKDQNWEDAVDNPYQSRPVPYAERFYKFIPSARPPSSSTSDDEIPVRREPHALRLRVGRGGRVHLDRRRAPRPAGSIIPLSPEASVDDSDQERRSRLRERWMFDADDGPSYGPDGSEEHDRMLLDDYQTKHLVHTMTLLQPKDFENFFTDPRLTVNLPEGRARQVIPAAIQIAQQMAARHTHRPSAPMGPPPVAPRVQPGPVAIAMPRNIGESPVAVKQMQPPSLLHMRVSSNGTMRPPSSGSSPAPSNAQLQQPGLNLPAPAINGAPIGSPTKSPLNGVGTLPEGAGEVTTNGISQPMEGVTTTGASPPKIQPVKQVVMPNGYQMGVVNAYAGVPTNATYLAHPGLTPQLQDMKNTYPNTTELNAHAGRPGFTAPVIANGANFNVSMGNAGFNLKLPPQRQTQWTTTRPMSGISGDSSAPTAGLPGAHSAMVLGHNGTPVRVPSTNGMRTMGPSVAHMMAATPRGASPQHQLAAQFAQANTHLSPHLHPAGSPLPAHQQGSPPRPVSSPIPPSPSMQQALPSANTNGY